MHSKCDSFIKTTLLPPVFFLNPLHPYRNLWLENLHAGLLNVYLKLTVSMTYPSPTRLHFTTRFNFSLTREALTLVSIAVTNRHSVSKMLETMGTLQNRGALHKTTFSCIRVFPVKQILIQIRIYLKKSLFL